MPLLVHSVGTLLHNGPSGGSPYPLFPPNGSTQTPNPTNTSFGATFRLPPKPLMLPPIATYHFKEWRQTNSFIESVLQRLTIFFKNNHFMVTNCCRAFAVFTLKSVIGNNIQGNQYFIKLKMWATWVRCFG